MSGGASTLSSKAISIPTESFEALLDLEDEDEAIKIWHLPASRPTHPNPPGNANQSLPPLSHFLHPIHIQTRVSGLILKSAEQSHVLPKPMRKHGPAKERPRKTVLAGSYYGFSSLCPIPEKHKICVFTNLCSRVS